VSSSAYFTTSHHSSARFWPQQITLEFTSPRQITAGFTLLHAVTTERTLLHRITTANVRALPHSRPCYDEAIHDCQNFSKVHSVVLLCSKLSSELTCQNFLGAALDTRTQSIIAKGHLEGLLHAIHFTT